MKFILSASTLALSVLVCGSCIAPTEPLPSRELPVLVQFRNESWILEFPLCQGETVVEVVLGSSDDTANPDEQVVLGGTGGAARESTSVRITLNAQTVATGEISPVLKKTFSLGTLDPAQTSFSIETSSGYAFGVRLSKLAPDLPVIVSGTREVKSADGYDPSIYCEV